MGTEKIRIGIVGTSGWAELMFLNTLPSHPQAEMAAICGRNSERVAELAAKYSIAQVFHDYQDMIVNGRLDAVVVATPDDLHYPITMAALEARQHVLCEKPLAMNASQAREMYDKAEAAGVRHMTVLIWRWPPAVAYMRQLLAEGYVGRPYHAEFRFVTGFNRDQAYQWRLDPQRSFGELADHGSHIFDLARLYLGEIARVSAHIASHAVHVGLDNAPMQSANDTAACLLEFANGVQGTVLLSSVAYLADLEWEQTVTIYGELGTLQTRVIAGSPDKPLALYGAREGSGPFQELEIPEIYTGGLLPGPFLPTMLQLLTTQSIGPRLFVDSILSGKTVAPSFYDGYKAQLVIDAALESHRLRRWITIADN